MLHLQGLAVAGEHHVDAIFTRWKAAGQREAVEADDEGRGQIRRHREADRGGRGLGNGEAAVRRRGINDDVAGRVSRKLGAKGLEQVIEITLTAEERIALQKSAAAVQELIDVLGI